MGDIGRKTPTGSLFLPTPVPEEPEPEPAVLFDPTVDATPAGGES